MINAEESGRIGWTGAEAILQPGLMLESQERILKSVLLHIDEIAEAEALRQERSKDYRVQQLRRRPHQVFLIDGARGAGKTTLLLTAQRYLKILGRPEEWEASENDAGTEFLRTFAQNIAEKLSKKDVAHRPKRFEVKHPVEERRRSTAHYLPVLFPSDLEFGQSIMEGVLALIARTLEVVIETEKKPEEKDRVTKAKDLLKRAHEKVAAGWFLSRNTGTDAILRDSADYEEFLSNRGKANVSSFSRVPIWRDFVNDYLDFFGSQLLVVFFDDTDLATAVSKDILHTIRIFLDHPRIVTVIAGNLHSIRQSLVLDEMKGLGGPIEALTAEAESTARDWRRLLRQEVEESLEKVLPRRFRYYITTAPEKESAQAQRFKRAAGDNGNADDISNGRQSDFERVFKMGFDALCQSMLDFWRKDFLTTRQKVHFRWLEDKQELWDENDERNLENYLSWWLFRHWYADKLKPKTVRHMAALRAYAMLPGTSKLAIDNLRSEHGKRLAVILFESPENFEVIHRLADGDHRVLSWLHRQNIESSWRGDRYIAINGRRIFENTYSFHFLSYRLDLAIALPVQENPQETIPQGILPVPDGPNLAKHRSFFLRSRQQKLFGVAKDFHHTLIPANCIYMFDVNALPDAAWLPNPPPAGAPSWESRLLYDWKDLFFFDLKELSDETGSVGEPATRQDQGTEAAEATSPAGGAATSSSGTDPSNGTIALADGQPAMPSQQPERGAAGPSEQPGPTDAVDRGPSAAAASSSEAQFQGDAEERSIALKEAWVSDYFVHTVIPLASISLGKYIGSHHEFSDRNNTAVGLSKETLLHKELEKSSAPFFVDVIKQIDSMLRRHDYLESVAGGGDARGVAPLAQSLLENWDQLLLQRVFSDGSEEDGSASGLSAEPLIDELRQLVLDAQRGRSHRRSSKAPVNAKELDTLSGQLVAYRWLVNDVRRGWHAARIFLNQVSGTLKDHSANDLTNQGTSGFDQAPEVTRRDRFFRGDHYTIGTRESLDRWLRRSPTLKAFLGLYQSRPLAELKITINPATGFYERESDYAAKQLKADVQSAIEQVLPTQRPAWDDTHDDWELNSEQLRAIFTARPRDVGRQIDFKGLFLAFDPSAHMTEGSNKQAVMTSRTYARLARSMLLFLFGFAPNLPALIHLEVAAILKRMQTHPADAGVDDAVKVLNAWGRWISTFLSTVDGYRRLLEFNQVKLDIMELARTQEGIVSKNRAKDYEAFDPAIFGVWMSLTPDIAFASVGVRGLALLPKLKFSGMPYAELHKARIKRWEDTARESGRVVWTSVIDTTLDNLLEALNFIESTRHVIAEKYPGAKTP